MRAQEQAFRAYYASMNDRDLLMTASNRSSFIELAQRILTEEVERRNLPFPMQDRPARTPPAGALGTALQKLLQKRRPKPEHN